MTNDELLSKTISYLRFPLTVGVVFIHFSLSEGLIIHGVKHGLGNPDWFFFIVNLISETFAGVGVPLFFMISGFLFFYGNNFDKDIYTKKLRSRFMTLFIPYFLWNVITIFWQLKCLLPGISSFYQPVEIQISIIRIFNTFFCNSNNSGIIIGPPIESTGIYPIDAPLWYVRDLMIMVLLSPVLYWFIKRTDKWGVTILGLVWLFATLIIPKGSYVGHLITASFFFSWGALFSITKENIVMHFHKLKHTPFIYVCIASVDALTKGMTYNVYIHKIGILLGIISAVIIVSYLLKYNKVKINSTLEKSSFFIFAFHNLFIGDLGKFTFIMLHMPENNPYAMLSLYFAIPIISVLICLSFYKSLKKYFPRICNLLTGGR